MNLSELLTLGHQPEAISLLLIKVGKKGHHSATL